jgi:hypothetical protein
VVLLVKQEAIQGEKCQQHRRLQEATEQLPLLRQKTILQQPHRPQLRRQLQEQMIQQLPVPHDKRNSAAKLQ